MSISPSQLTNALTLSSSIVHSKRPCWIAVDDAININGQIIPSKYGEALENIQAGTVITMTLTHAGVLSKSLFCF